MPTQPSSPSGPPGQLLVLPFYDGSRVIVVLSGEADMATARHLRARLAGSITHRPRSLVVDARDLAFCDLRGLDALTDAIEAAERAGVTVTLRPSPQLAWLAATLERFPQTSGRLGQDPPGRPLPAATRQTA